MRIGTFKSSWHIYRGVWHTRVLCFEMKYPLSTPEQNCIGWPEQNCIDGAAARPLKMGLCGGLYARRSNTSATGRRCCGVSAACSD